MQEGYRKGARSRKETGAEDTSGGDGADGLQRKKNLKKRKKSRDDSRPTRLGSPRHALSEQYFR
jgi:hypothetical protein